MNLKLLRDRHEQQYTGGKLYLDGQFFCWTLEPAPPLIPLSGYQVILDPSPKAAAGLLWTPDPEFRLPLLLDVPGHTGMRIHAGNFTKDTQGCILVGDIRADETIYQSRQALTRLLRRFQVPCWLEITDVGHLKLP